MWKKADVAPFIITTKLYFFYASHDPIDETNTKTKVGQQ